MASRGKMVCPGCLNEFEYAAERGGQTANCPHCMAPLRLPVLASRAQALRSRQLLEREAEAEDSPRSRFDDPGLETFQPAAFALFFGVVSLLLSGGLWLGGAAPWTTLILAGGALLFGLGGLLLAVFAMVNIWLNREVYSGWTFAITGTLLSVVFGAIVPWAPALRSFQQVNTRAGSASALANFSSVVSSHFEHDDDQTRTLPADIRSPDGTSLLSWRVAILPALGHGALFSRFHLDEPWDSPHNLKLVASMPSQFRCSEATLPIGHTICMHAAGTGTVFGNRPISPEKGETSLENPASEQIFLVQAKPEMACEWTRPFDWTLDPVNARKSLDALEPEGLLGLLDGQVVRLDTELTTEQIVAWFRGEAVTKTPLPLPQERDKSPEGGAGNPEKD